MCLGNDHLYYSVEDGIRKYSLQTKKTIKIDIWPKELHCSSIKMDKNEVLWLGTLQNGLYSYKDSLIKKIDFQVLNNAKEIKKIEIEGKYVWILATSGFYSFNTLSKSVTNYSVFEEFDDSFHDMYLDEGNIYLLGKKTTKQYSLNELNIYEKIRDSIWVEKISVNNTVFQKERVKLT